jgi:GNAT superfamily N-acetyltransferase
MIIRELHDNDLLQAIQLKVQCWPEEMAGMSDKKLDVEKEYLFWFDWMHHGIENNDVRTLIGAFENDQLLGTAFASFAEKEDSDHGIELNGLWVSPHARGRKISIKLLSKILEYYENLGFNEIVIYNFHNSTSNSYYRKLGAKVLRTEYQLEERVPVDVFLCDIEIMKNHINESISNELTDQS